MQRQTLAATGTSHSHWAHAHWQPLAHRSAPGAPAPPFPFRKAWGTPHVRAGDGSLGIEALERALSCKYVAADAFGVVNMMGFSRIGMVVVGAAMALGVLTGKMLGTRGLEAAAAAGTSTQRAFSLFFYLCCGVMVVAAGCMVAVMWGLRRRNAQAQEQAQAAAEAGAEEKGKQATDPAA